MTFLYLGNTVLAFTRFVLHEIWIIQEYLFVEQVKVLSSVSSGSYYNLANNSFQCDAMKTSCAPAEESSVTAKEAVCFSGSLKYLYTHTFPPSGHQAYEIINTVLQNAIKYSSTVKCRIHLPHVLEWIYAIWFGGAIKNSQASSQIVLSCTYHSVRDSPPLEKVSVRQNL